MALRHPLSRVYTVQHSRNQLDFPPMGFLVHTFGYGGDIWIPPESYHDGRPWGRRPGFESGRIRFSAIGAIETRMRHLVLGPLDRILRHIGLVSPIGGKPKSVGGASETCVIPPSGCARDSRRQGRKFTKARDGGRLHGHGIADNGSLAICSYPARPRRCW